MKKILNILFLCSLLLTACSSNEEEIKSEITKTIKMFYDELLLENLDGSMSYISKDSEEYYELYDEYRLTFEKYKYSYDLNEISFNEITKNRIVVSVSLVISGVDENDKYDSFKEVQVFTIKKNNNGDYKIYDIETKYDI
ncbi:hypothetical protein AAGG74_14520 [Bacillus mexicanus]|uniref:hypothetical protein n=1 Tax=Bacillus mexicanus TaxID=2834415 RepID=UPI003D261A93